MVVFFLVVIHRSVCQLNRPQGPSGFHRRRACSRRSPPPNFPHFSYFSNCDAAACPPPTRTSFRLLPARSWFPQFLCHVPPLQSPRATGRSWSACLLAATLCFSNLTFSFSYTRLGHFAMRALWHGGHHWFPRTFENMVV